MKENNRFRARTRSTVMAIAIVVLVAVSSVAFYELVISANSSCSPLGAGGLARSQLSPHTFGSVTEYPLPAPSRWPNAIAVAPDGSVWFGEEGYPGIAHLFPNGTLLEYSWPGSTKLSNPSNYVAGVWGVAYWNGMIWGADLDQGKLVGLDASRACAVTVNLPADAADPYTLAVSPDGSLWFTSLAGSQILGRVSQNLSLSIINVSLPKGEMPAQLQFVNSTAAYFVTIDPDSGSGGIYAFNPHSVTPEITPKALGTGYHLLEPNSLSVSDGMVWVVQHYPSILAAFDVRSDAWSFYPTSTENYTTTTLPYFVQANGTKIWFNEHYGNRIAVIDAAKNTLTEYSEANPPVENGTDIQNDLTIAVTNSRVWFTSTTGNYIGYVDATQTPGFSLVPSSNVSSVMLSPGENATLSFDVEGHWSTALTVASSDNENFTGVPKLVRFDFEPGAIPPGSGQAKLLVTVEVESSLSPGEYTLAVTVSDGLVSQSCYVFLDVK